MIPVHPVTPKPADSEARKWKICDGNNHLTNRSEPADTELGSAGAGGTGTGQKRGDGGVELCRHRLHPPLVQRLWLSYVAGAILQVQEADGRGVALERLVRERIDLQRSSRWRNRTSLLVGEW